MLRKILAAACLAILVTSSGAAQLNYSVVSEQHNVAITSATALGCPSGANYAAVQVVSDNAYYTFNTSTPSTTNGFYLQQNQTVPLYGSIFVQNFKIITAASGGKINFVCAIQ